jgi:uncharacterized membrane protein YhiD involved in acid resistance
LTPPLSDTELIQRLLLAAVLGGIIGFEREMRQKSAGLRTNMLIAIGSALFTLMSYELAEGAWRRRSSPASGFSERAPSCGPMPGFTA